MGLLLGAACASKTPSGTGAAGAGGDTATAGTGGAAAGTGGSNAGTGGVSGSGGATGGGGGSGGGGVGGSGGGNGGGGSGSPDASVTDASDASAAQPTDASDGPAAATILGHPTPGATYPTHAGFSLYLVEEFDQPLDLDKDPMWTWGDGTILDGLARFGEDAITFADGKMKLTVTKADTPAGFSVVKGGTVDARTLKSGEMRSKYNLFRWGRYEVSMKAPTLDGNYIQSMFTYRTPTQQEWREIDFELVSNLPKTISTNIIIGQNMTMWAATAEDPTTTYPFEAQPAMALPAGLDTQAKFHTYAFEALPDHITFFVDDVPVRTKMTGVGKNNLLVPERSMKVMFNLWVFNQLGFGGDPSKNTYPFTGEYDWFRFYKWDQDTKYPCAPFPACLPADDKDLSANNPKEMPTP